MFKLIGALLYTITVVRGQSAAYRQAQRILNEAHTPNDYSKRTSTLSEMIETNDMLGNQPAHQQTQLKLPDNGVAVLINRSNELIVVSQDTQLQIGDVIVVMADTAALGVIKGQAAPTPEDM